MQAIKMIFTADFNNLCDRNLSVFKFWQVLSSKPGSSWLDSYFPTLFLVCSSYQGTISRTTSLISHEDEDGLWEKKNVNFVSPKLDVENIFWINEVYDAVSNDMQLARGRLRFKNCSYG